jgi:hypothetical protein
MKVIDNYNFQRKITSRIKLRVNNNLSQSNKLRRDLREEMIIVMTKMILKNTKGSHSQVRLWRYLRRKK